MRMLEFGWFIPTRGDTDDYGDPIKISAGLEMFDRVAIAAEKAGFEYMLIPVGHQCWDAWMTGAMMTRKTTQDAHAHRRAAELHQSGAAGEDDRHLRPAEPVAASPST